MYENEWGNGLEGATNWDEFQINKKLYDQIEACLVLDEVPIKRNKIKE